MIIKITHYDEHHLFKSSLVLMTDLMLHYSRYGSNKQHQTLHTPAHLSHVGLGQISR